MPDRPKDEAPSDVMLSDIMLSFVSPTRKGEAGTAILLTLNVFVLLLAYYLVKVAREQLILTEGGAEVKSYAAAGQAVLLIPVSYAYSAVARLVPRVRLIGFVTLFFISNLALFALLALAGVKVGVPFFIWVGIFNLTMIAAQFWGFAADIYDEERGKRMFPILGIGSGVGALAGSFVGGWAGKQKIPPPFLMIGTAVLLCVCIALTVAVDRREAARDRQKAPPKPLGPASGFSLVLRDRYLLLIGLLVFVFNWVNTNGEYILDKTLVASNAGLSKEAAEAAIGEFKGKYFAWFNGVSLFLQVFVVSRFIRHVGVRAALFVMPIVSLFSYSSLAVFPLLSVVFVAKVAENGLDYSLHNTSRQALWLVTSRDDKYKAKHAIDTFLQRAGDVMSAGLVALGTWLSMGTKGFAATNVGLVLCWIGALILLTREHKRRAAKAREST